MPLINHSIDAVHHLLSSILNMIIFANLNLLDYILIFLINLSKSWLYWHKKFVGTLHFILFIPRINLFTIRSLPFQKPLNFNFNLRKLLINIQLLLLSKTMCHSLCYIITMTKMLLIINFKTKKHSLKETLFINFSYYQNIYQ